MAISLNKGQNVSLSKTDPSLRQVMIGLGWDARSSDGADFDLDASLFMTGDNKKVPSDAYFIFYNQLRSPEGAVEHTGDNLTGDGDGDDESILVQLDKLPANISSLFITVTIHDAEIRRQNFGEIYRRDGEWKFRAIGQGYSGGLYALCQQYGVNVG